MSLLNESTNFNNGQGDPLTRQISYSHFIPHSLTGYKDFFRQSSNAEKGFMMLKEGESQEWTRKFFVFDDFELKYADLPTSPESEFKHIDLDQVVNLCTDHSAREPTIKIATTQSKLQLKVPDLDQMHKWLFCFQKSVALVLTHILESKSKKANFLQAELEDRNLWLQMQGHGRYQNVARRHGNQTLPPSASRAYTLEDLGTTVRDSAGGDKDVLFAARWTGREQGGATTRILAVSPAIPIGGHLAVEDDYDRRERVASSFKDDADKFSPLEEMLQYARRRGQEDLQSEDEDEAGQSVSDNNDAEADYMMFEMEDMDMVESKQNVVAEVNRSRSRSSDESRGVSRRPSTSRSAHSPLSVLAASVAGSLSHHDSSMLKRLNSKYLRWRSGTCSKFGPREKNEDRFVSMPTVPQYDHEDLISESRAQSHRTDGSRHMASSHGSRSEYGGGSEEEVGYFAVYDGHCGDEAACFLQEVLMERICRHPLFQTNIEQAISETCISLDAEFLDICKRRSKYCGTTAIGAFLVGSSLVVFNIGDSMAVLCTGGVACEMSNSHKPGRKDEAERIKKANGWITEEKELYLARLHHMDLADPLVMGKAQSMSWVTTHRVCGELAVSRSIGDPDYKSFVPGANVNAFFSWPDGHNQVFMADLVIPDPECKFHKVGAEDEFLVLASDGLWDVISPPEVVQYVKRSFGNQKSPSEVAEELCDLSIRLGSGDNVTVVIVQFVHQ